MMNHIPLQQKMKRQLINSSPDMSYRERILDTLKCWSTSEKKQLLEVLQECMGHLQAERQGSHITVSLPTDVRVNQGQERPKYEITTDR